MQLLIIKTIAQKVAKHLCLHIYLLYHRHAIFSIYWDLLSANALSTINIG